MKYHSKLNSFYGLVIGFAGLAATVSAPQAADIGMAVQDKWTATTMTAQPQTPASAASLPRSPNAGIRNAKGPQGPIRTDFSDQAVADTETLRRDLQANRYPMNSSVGIP